MSRTGKSTETEKRLVAARSGGEGLLLMVVVFAVV